jgi:hypothetical protein
MESERLGPDGDEVLSHITGMDPKTIQRGRQELERELADRPRERVRLPGGGRPRAEKKTQPSKARWRRWWCRKRQGIP